MHFTYQFSKAPPPTVLGFAQFNIPRPVSAGEYPPSSCCESAESLDVLRVNGMSKLTDPTVTAGGIDFVWSEREGPRYYPAPIGGVNGPRQFVADPVGRELIWLVKFPDGSQKIVRHQLSSRSDGPYFIQIRFDELKKSLSMTINGVPAKAFWPGVT